MSADNNTPTKRRFRTMDDDEQATHLRRRAKVLQMKQYKARISEILEESDDAVHEVKALLEGQGHSFAKLLALKKGRSRTDLAEPVETPFGESPIKAEVQGEDEGITEIKEEKNSRLRGYAGIQDPNPRNWIPHKYTRMDNCSVPQVVDILSQVEEISLSRAALGAITSKGLRDQKLSSLLDHFEYATGQPREMALTGDRRHVPTLVSWLRTCVLGEGRRARDLKVLGMWGFPGDGCYELRKFPDGLGVVDRGSNQHHMIPCGFLLRDAHDNVIQLEELMIEFNFSAQKAIVSSSLTMDSLRIAELGQLGRQGSRLATFLQQASSNLHGPSVAMPLPLMVKKEAPAVLKNRSIAQSSRTTEKAWSPPPPPPPVLADPVKSEGPVHDGKAEDQGAGVKAAVLDPKSEDDNDEAAALEVFHTGGFEEEAYEDEDLMVNLAAAVKVDKQ